MSLTYGSNSPWDLLEKAKRDLVRLELAEVSANEIGMGDAIFDLAVTLDSVKDWLKEQPGRAFTNKSLHLYRTATNSLAAFRDLSIAAKHRTISDHSPTTTGVESSAVALTEAALGEVTRARVLKVIRTTGARQRATDLARAAIRDWDAFMVANDVAR